MNAEAFLAHIHSRLLCAAQEAAESTRENGWLAQPGDPVDLAGYGVEIEPQEFNYDLWLETPIPAFKGRTPRQVIDDGTEAERNRLAHAVDAVAALLDGGFS